MRVRWFSFESEHAYLSGKCDRIDIDAQDKISIIDYKTSQTTKTENEIKKDIQLGIYALFLFIKKKYAIKNNKINNILKNI